MSAQLEVLDPTNGAAPVETEALPRPSSLAGLVVGCLDNGKPNSDRFLDRLAARLQADGVRDVVRARKPSIGRLAAPELLDDLATRCDVVVTGVGDCAGCCPCSVQDGVALERRGTPTYVVCTSELLTTATIAATTAGVPRYPFVVVEHPLGSLTEDALAGRSRDAWRQISGARVPGRLADRVVVVTGAAHGLGRAYAVRLAAAGARVAVVDIAGQAAGAVAAAITATAGPDAAVPHEADVTDEHQVRGLVEAVLDRWGRIDALVNNAGGALLPAAPFDSVVRADWTRVLDLNLTAPWICAAAVAPAMRSAGYGKIVNVGSTTVSRGNPVGLAPYIAAKAGVVGLTRALARELGGDGIRVNAIAPGYVPVDTPPRPCTPPRRRAPCASGWPPSSACRSPGRRRTSRGPWSSSARPTPTS
nr:SDR family NAD(P)-dependent oxidoreductase [Pseudonocardia nigra]